jgi:hypothetical protein
MTELDKGKLVVAGKKKFWGIPQKLWLVGACLDQTRKILRVWSGLSPKSDILHKLWLANARSRLWLFFPATTGFP